MTNAARKLLDTFNSLPQGERQEVLSELLRRAGLIEHDSPDDADLLAAADTLFLELDQREHAP